MEFKIITKQEFEKSVLPSAMTFEDVDTSDFLLIRYADPEFPTLQINENGDWIDIKCAKDYSIKKGEKALIDLGVAMKLPEGYEAHLVPRSGTFKKYGLIQTNSIGIIDNSYSGNNDIWKMPVYALDKDIEILKGERLCQFRLMPTMSSLMHGNRLFKASIIIVDNLDSSDRGGFGSTGR